MYFLRYKDSVAKKIYDTMSVQVLRILYCTDTRYNSWLGWSCFSNMKGALCTTSCVYNPRKTTKEYSRDCRGRAECTGSVRRDERT